MVLGLDAAGKTTLLNTLKGELGKEVAPTFGFKTEVSRVCLLSPIPHPPSPNNIILHHSAYGVAEQCKGQSWQCSDVPCCCWVSRPALMLIQANHQVHLSDAAYSPEVTPRNVIAALVWETLWIFEMSAHVSTGDTPASTVLNRQQLYRGMNAGAVGSVSPQNPLIQPLLATYLARVCFLKCLHAKSARSSPKPSRFPCCRPAGDG